MKELTLLFLSLIGCSAYLIKVPTTNVPTQPRIAPLGWVHIQKLLLPLFDNVCEDSTNMAINQLAQDFTLDSSNGDYMKLDVVENLRSIKNGRGFLPKGQIFTESNMDHVNELKALFELFLYAKDFDTFYRAAAWARQNVNCGLFVDAIYLAIVNRKDTAKVSVPAPYELLPNYFINKDEIVKASFLLTADDITPTPEADVQVEGNSYILDTNYTSEMDDGDDDAKLAYFREDIGLNSFYFIRKLRNAPWFNTPNVADNMYGERMFMMMRQFAARYDLERYSHGLPELEGFDWESTMPYDPMLVYSNGNEFGHRTFTSTLSDNEDVAFLKTIENNLATVVAHLRQAGHNKSQILSHLMEILVTSDKSYETLCRKLLGYDTDAVERNYSVLEHYMTTLRDPIFWKINKKMVQIIDNAMKNLPSYSRNELYFPGVEVLNVETKKMMTTFDRFQFDVTDSLKTSTANTTFQVKIAQPRLNHKPFVMKFNISSLVTKKGLVKIFIGPRMMPGELAMKKHLFVLLDMFEVTLKRGYNVISRSSDEMNFSNDFISLRALRKKVEDAEFGLDALPLNTVESQIGYPSRLILPRGLPEGLPLQVFVFVAPLTKGILTVSSIANMEINTAVFSPGYPLDLPFEIRQIFGLPNSLVRQFTVTHKSETNVNGGRPTPGGRPEIERKPGVNGYNFDQTFDNHQTVNSFDDNTRDYDLYDDPLTVRGLLGERPDFTYKKTDSSNYAGKKEQYRKKEDYASKSIDRVHNYAENDFLVNKEDKFNTASDSNDKFANSLPMHGLLGSRSDFAYKNKFTPENTAKKMQYKWKEDFVSTNRNEIYKPHDTSKNKIYNSVPIKTIVEDDIQYVDTLISHGLLGEKLDNTNNNADTGKFDQYIKKEEERAAKREQKKEKYITKGKEKREESMAKGDKKKEESLAKKEKYANTVYKTKGIDGSKVYDIWDTTYDTKSINTMTNKDDSNEFLGDNKKDANVFTTNDFISHNLLGKSDSMIKKNTSYYKNNMFQYKKIKEEYDPAKTQYKKVDFREEVKSKDDKNSGDLLKSKKYVVIKDDKYEKKYKNTDNDRAFKEKTDNGNVFIMKNNSMEEIIKSNESGDTFLIKRKNDKIGKDYDNRENDKAGTDKLNKNDILNSNLNDINIQTDTKNVVKVPTKETIDSHATRNSVSKLTENKKTDVSEFTDSQKYTNVDITNNDYKDKTPTKETNTYLFNIKNDKMDEYDNKENYKVGNENNFQIYESTDKINKDDIFNYVVNSSIRKDVSKVIENKKSYDTETDFLEKNYNNNKDISTIEINNGSKDIYKVIDGKEVNKNVVYDKLNKNVVLDKKSVTKKDITKEIPVVKTSDSIECTSEEVSEELNTFTIYEPIITTEMPKSKKRVTVYDFLFNPTEYDDDGLKVYE